MPLFLGLDWGAAGHAVCCVDESGRASPWAADIYGKARARGCRHPHAVRIVARAWLRVLWRAWQDRQPYDPVRHAAAAKLALS